METGNTEIIFEGVVMTIKDAFINHGYIVAPLPVAMRDAAVNWINTNFPNDPVRFVRKDDPTICFRPNQFDFLIGFEYDATDPSHLWVNSLSTMQNALLAIKDRRIVLPITQTGSVRDTSFYAFQGNVYVPNFGLITNADFINLATFVRESADPDV